MARPEKAMAKDTSNRSIENCHQATNAVAAKLIKTNQATFSSL